MAGSDPELKAQLLKSARLWTMSAVCALVGAATVWATDSLGLGVLAFLGCLVVLGPALWLYQRKRR